MPHAYRLPHRSTPPARRSKAFDNAVLRAFLRAAAIAFALGSDAAPAASTAPPHEADRHGQTTTTRRAHEAAIDIALLDTAGHTVLRLQADGPLSLIPPTGGPYLLRVTRQGVTHSQRLGACRDGAPSPIRL
ncbi:MAG: hypothetical protein R3E34_14400 [Rhodocyclaceae bacterium]